MAPVDLYGDEDAVKAMFGSTEEYVPPFQKKYFTSEMMGRYEPLADAIAELETTDGEPDKDALKNFQTHYEAFMDFTWCSQWDGKKYDVVFYGMSGYSGYLIMEYLKSNVLRKNEKALTFAFAGRTTSKVVEMRDREFAGTPWADTPVLVADFDDVVSVVDVVKSAHVIVNVAGPYMLTEGEVLIDACIWCKTDYVDMSQELPWSLRIKDLHQYAMDAGVHVVPSACGSAYADLGVYVLAKKLKEDYGEAVRSAACYCTGEGTPNGASGGVLKTRTALTNVSGEAKRQLNDPFSMGGFIPEIDRNGIKSIDIQQGTGYATVKTRDEDKDSKILEVTHDDKLGVWRAPHVNSFFDTRIVRRSNMLHADLGNQPYGTAFNFMEYALLPDDKASDAQKEAKENGAMPFGSYGIPFDEEAQAGNQYAEGEGPTPDAMKAAYTGFMLYAETAGGNGLKCSFVGGDAYLESARMAVETAMTLRFDRASLPYKGGVLTASTSGGGALIKRLTDSGAKFKMGGWFEGADLKAPSLDGK